MGDRLWRLHRLGLESDQKSPDTFLPHGDVDYLSHDGVLPQPPLACDATPDVYVRSASRPSRRVRSAAASSLFTASRALIQSTRYLDSDLFCAHLTIVAPKRRGCSINSAVKIESGSSAQEASKTKPQKLDVLRSKFIVACCHLNMGLRPLMTRIRHIIASARLATVWASPHFGPNLRRNSL